MPKVYRVRCRTRARIPPYIPPLIVLIIILPPDDEGRPRSQPGFVMSWLCFMVANTKGITGKWSKNFQTMWQSLNWSIARWRAVNSYLEWFDDINYFIHCVIINNKWVKFILDVSLLVKVAETFFQRVT